MGTQASPNPGALRTPPIGRPIDGVGVLVLDRGMQPSPIGVDGEIHLSGAGLARGYLGSPGLTAERFVPHPRRAGERLYRTGDVGRWTEDGALEFGGRRDEQIKLRGVRIELAEVARAVASQPGVSDARVVVVRPAGGEARLVAFVVGNGPVDVARIGAGVKLVLPAESAPASIVALERWPMTANGKVDQRALLALAEQGPGEAVEAPVTDVQRRLAALWGRLLGAPRVGLGSSFVELGGNSMTAMQAVVAIEREMGVRVPLTQVFATPVLRDLAEAVERAPAAPAGGEAMSKEGSPENGSPSLVRLSVAGPGRVFCMPSVFGHAGVFAELAGLVRARSFEGFDASERAVSAGAYAEAVLRAQPAGAVVLLGYSAGGNVAFAVAQAIERRGGHVEKIVLMDSSFREAPRTVSEAEIAERLETILRASRQGPEGGGVEDAVFRRRAAALLRGYFEGKDAGRVRADIHFVRAADSPPGRARRWAEATSRVLTEHQGAGGHFEMLHGAAARANAALIDTLLGA